MFACAVDMTTRPLGSLTPIANVSVPVSVGQRDHAGRGADRAEQLLATTVRSLPLAPISMPVDPPVAMKSVPAADVDDDIDVFGVVDRMASAILERDRDGANIRRPRRRP